jgi:glyceraldehyde-3-phosphate dehydrogenase (NADP+)
MVVTDVCQATAEDVERALALAVAARPALAAQPRGERRQLLTRMAQGLAEQLEPLARTMALEAGKPIALARGEVKRAIETFTQAAAEAVSARGEVVGVDLDASTRGATCVVERAPAGVVVGISPFNFPLNLAAHKVAPALAVGAPLLLKPPPQAPSAALVLGELAARAGALPGALSVLPCPNALAEVLATDGRVRVLSFTGSGKAGWHLRAKAAARVLLELGGAAGAIVCEDADVEPAAAALAASAFAYAGQVCISVQRIVVHRAVERAFTQALLAHTARLAVGDPLEDECRVGPVIDDGAATRITSWVDEAVAAGARVLCGHTREGRLLQPTVVAGVSHAAKLWREEVFGPVVVLEAYDDFEQALASVNDSPWGLQAAIFTHDLRRVRRAYEALEVGGLVVNDSPSFRSDGMPYGGLKGSGLGREGVRYAMEELTEPRALITLRG